MYRSKPSKKKRQIVLTKIEEKDTNHDARDRMQQTLDSDLFSVLINIQEKLNSSVFNGGFETLVSTVDAMRTTQEQMHTDFSDMKEAMYEPDNGLYARVKTVEKNQDEKIQTVEKHQGEKNAEIEKITTDLTSRVKKLEELKINLNKVLWAAGPVFLGLLGKFAYDLIVNHVVFK